MSRVGTVLTELATCLCSELLAPGVPPVCFCGVVPGAEVALDYLGDCDPCGMAWVRLISSYPSTTVGVPNTEQGNCSRGIGIEVELGIVRCVSVGESDGTPPTPTELETATRLQMDDMLTMWRAVLCCRRAKDFVIGSYAPYGPEGGVVGGTLPVLVLVT